MSGEARVTQGSPEPLGASLLADGVNFAVWAAEASAVEVCLFDADDVETARVPLPSRTGPVFHGRIAGLGHATRYGLRAHGRFDPARGLRFDPGKLLLDPWAIALDRPFDLDPSLFAPPGGADSAGAMPKAIVLSPDSLPPPPAPPPVVAWGEAVIYELHVRGFTRAHPDIPEALRGTFAGLAHPAAVAHLKGLGITTVELMPAAAWIDERHLPPLGLTNAWGYNPIAFLAPEPRMAPGGWAEVRAATEALAAAGIETILDVVLNHSGEGDELGPTLSLRGLANRDYYRLDPADPALYLNDAGTGSMLALDRAPGLRLAMDALRAWRRLGGVHGFRFDLATVLGRRDTGFDPAAPLLAAIEQDPELRGLKLIAEPWDCGPGGHQLGAFPPAWGEWNDRFRDDVRGFWRGDGVSRGTLARRLSGSQDAFGARRPSRSVNFVVAHDGFTLADLVSHAHKHNEANGEANRDGTNDNRSWNHGVEGPSNDQAIRAARLRDQRALLATLLLARGTPMLTMGAELGRTQGGNNNAYAQDNAMGRIDWTGANHDLIAFTRALIAARAAHPALRADRFLSGAPSAASPWPDVAWGAAGGAGLDASAWDDPGGQTLVMTLCEPTPGGLDRVAVAIHRGDEIARITLPAARNDHVWRRRIDSFEHVVPEDARHGPHMIHPRSVVLFVETPSPGARGRAADDATVARLSRAAGVAPTWKGVEGRERMVARPTHEALLAAMSLPAATTHEALDSLARLARETDRRSLPQAAIAAAGAASRIRLPHPDGAVTAHGRLILQGEDGEVVSVRLDDAGGEQTAWTCRNGAPARGLEIDLPPLTAGRWRLRREDDPAAEGWVIAAPDTCFSPPALAGDRRLWGLSAQIYALRREGDQGVGDFTTLGELGARAGARGAGVLAVNPFHALFPGDRERASPYYPSDRRFLDPIYLDLARLPSAPAASGPTPDGPAIDYPAVWAEKARRLEAAFAAGVDEAALDAFIAAGGESLRRFTLFHAQAEAQPGRARYHAWLQMIAEEQLAAAARRAAALPLGFCRDLAVGAAPDGAEAWAEAGNLARGVSIGAPPDAFAPKGQVWGLPPYIPHRLAEDGFALTAGLLRANMRHAGALRIDHVMSLSRLFWVPDGAEGEAGAYVGSPEDGLLAMLALESRRAHCLVVGEDLGVVPEGFRDRMSAKGVLGCRVLSLEISREGATSPATYARAAWACVTTHDLPPLAGWWNGVDIEERLSLGQIDAAEADRTRQNRRAEIHALIGALVDAGLTEAGADEAETPPLTPALAGAIHAWLAASPAAIALAQVEDLAGEREAVNLPGTDRERPNWRRRVSPLVERLFEGDLAVAILAALDGRGGDASTMIPSNT